MSNKKIGMNNTEIMDAIQNNLDLINSNSSKISIIKSFNNSNSEKIAEIAGSLSSIKNILQEANKKMGITTPAQEQKILLTTSQKNSTSISVKKDDFDRHSVQIDNLMDRIFILEKKLKSIQQTGNYTLESADKKMEIALYDYFEYFVISTVALFFCMFIIIFILANKTRHLHVEIDKLSTNQEIEI